MKLKRYGKTYDVYLKKDKYINNQNLAIVIFEKDDDYYPFAFLTVNTEIPLPKNLAFVDVNNCEWAEEFIQENELGKPTENYTTSGFVDYPLYEFDLYKVSEC